MSPRALLGWLVGYTALNIWRIWLPEAQRVVVCRDVLFDESVVYRNAAQQTSTSFDAPVSAEEYFDLIDNVQPEFVEADEDGMGAPEENNVSSSRIRAASSSFEQHENESHMPTASAEVPIGPRGASLVPFKEARIRFQDTAAVHATHESAPTSGPTLNVSKPTSDVPNERETNPTVPSPTVPVSVNIDTTSDFLPSDIGNR